eukprot:COSAG02_NODE_5948_length_3919_cov_14.379581_5_plen_367_part_01
MLVGSAFAKAVKLLSRYMTAIAEDPDEPRYRRIFGSNPTLVKRLGACPELLLACDWTVDGVGAQASYVYRDDKDGSVARCTLQVLSRAASGVVTASRPSVVALQERSLARTNAQNQIKLESVKSATPLRVKQECVSPSHTEQAIQQAEAAAEVDEWEQATRLAAAAQRRATCHSAVTSERVPEETLHTEETLENMESMVARLVITDQTANVDGCDNGGGGGNNDHELIEQLVTEQQEDWALEAEIEAEDAHNFDEEAEAERQAAAAEEARWLAAEREEAERERLAAEQAEHERLTAEQAEHERLTAEQAEHEGLATEQFAETEASHLAKDDDDGSGGGNNDHELIEQLVTEQQEDWALEAEIEAEDA